MNHPNSLAENHDRSGTNSHEGSQEREFGRTQVDLPARRFSRLLHKLEVKPEERDIKSRNARSELRLNLREAVFDIRHEELDYAAAKTKSSGAPPADEDEDSDEVSASTNQQPTPLSTILADKPYAQPKGPTATVEIAEPAGPAPIKTYKTYIMYGFLAGLAAVLILAIAISN